MDIDEVKQFVNFLADLKFNSKPIINTLTQIAHENIRYCKEFVTAIEDRIRQVCVYHMIKFINSHTNVFYNKILLKLGSTTRKATSFVSS